MTTALTSAMLPDDSMYMDDAAYHTNQYLIEEALRRLGVGDTPSDEGVASVYDANLRKLIDAVPLE